MLDPLNLSASCCGCGNYGCAGGVCGREVLPPLNAEVALLFFLGVSPKTPRKLFLLPSTLLLCTAVVSVMITMLKRITLMILANRHHMCPMYQSDNQPINALQAKPT